MPRRLASPPDPLASVCIGPTPVPAPVSQHALKRYHERFPGRASGWDLMALLKLQGILVEREVLERYRRRSRHSRVPHAAQAVVAAGGVFPLSPDGLVITAINLVHYEEILTDAILRALGFPFRHLPPTLAEEAYAA